MSPLFRRLRAFPSKLQGPVKTTGVLAAEAKFTPLLRTFVQLFARVIVEPPVARRGAKVVPLTQIGPVPKELPLLKYTRKELLFSTVPPV